jgi:NAD+-processing family protein with receiver domain
MKTLLWLDDVRNPLENGWLVFSPIEQPYELIWVKQYQEFIDWINVNGLPDAICFDHDLGEESYMTEFGFELLRESKTGYDCAKWLVDHCIDNDKPLPLYNIQSANPVGKENIDSLLKNYIKFRNDHSRETKDNL